MKLANWFIDKFGVDKMLHFLGGALIVAIFSPFGWGGVLSGFVLMLILSFIKEKYLDSVYDNKDIIAATLGGIVSVAIYAIIDLII